MPAQKKPPPVERERVYADTYRPKPREYNEYGEINEEYIAPPEYTDKDREEIAKAKDEAKVETKD
jgi:hypothetical protein